MPDSQIPGFLRSRFGQTGDELTFTAESLLWLKERAIKATGFHPDRMAVVQVRNFYSHQNQIATLDSVVVDRHLTISLDVNL